MIVYGFFEEPFLQSFCTEKAIAKLHTVFIQFYNHNSFHRNIDSLGQQCLLTY